MAFAVSFREGTFDGGKSVFTSQHKCVLKKVFGGAGKSATLNARTMRYWIIETLEKGISEKLEEEQKLPQEFWHQIFGNLVVTQNTIKSYKV